MLLVLKSAMTRTAVTRMEIQTRLGHGQLQQDDSILIALEVAREEVQTASYYPPSTIRQLSPGLTMDISQDTRR